MRSLVFFVVVLCSCALRPTYKSLVSAPGPAVRVLLSSQGQPLPNVKVEFGEWKGRTSLVTAADGTFMLPAEKKWLDENPVFVVGLPAGVKRYQLTLAEAPVVESVPAVQMGPALQPLEATDAGVVEAR